MKKKQICLVAIAMLGLHCAHANGPVDNQGVIATPHFFPSEEATEATPLFFPEEASTNTDSASQKAVNKSESSDKAEGKDRCKNCECKKNKKKKEKPSDVKKEQTEQAALQPTQGQASAAPASKPAQEPGKQATIKTTPALEQKVQGQPAAAKSDVKVAAETKAQDSTASAKTEVKQADKKTEPKRKEGFLPFKN